MRAIIGLAAVAMLLTIYDAESDRISSEAEDAASSAASTVQTDLDYKMDRQDRRIEELENEVRYRSY